MANMRALEGMLEFVAVVERGTFTSAARHLDVSVSHVSRQVSKLEARLGAQLFVRNTRQMHITEAGKRLFEKSHPLLQDLLSAQETILENREAIEGTIKISLAGKYAEDRLVPALTRFCAEHTGVHLDLDLSARNVDLMAEGFHLAVRMGPMGTTSSLTATRLLSVPLHVLAKPALLRSLPEIQTPKDLPPESCLPLVNRPWNFAKDNRNEGIKPLGRFSSNSGAAIIRAALDGLGIANVPAYYSDRVIANGSLVRILEDWRSIEESIFYIVYPTGRHMPVRVRRLIGYLQDTLKSAAN